MTGLERLIPHPALVEIDRVEVAADVHRTWKAVRDLDLAESKLVRTLFGIRTLPDRLKGRMPGLRLRIDDLVSTPEQPGFQALVMDPPRELAVGAIGQVWKPRIPFVHVADAASYTAFKEPGYIKVAWAIHVRAENALSSAVEFELRVDATTADAWNHFRRYYTLIGPASHFMRRLLLAQLERQLGTPEGVQNDRALPGDDVIHNPMGQLTHSIVIDAYPADIWPWLVQIGCRRAGFYSYDHLDNGGVPSAQDIRPDLQRLEVGDRIAATPEGDGHFDVLRIEPFRVLVLGSLFDVERQRQVPFDADRPRRYWHVSWAFVLEPLDHGRTRLLARVRAACSPRERLRAFWIRPVHHLMQTRMLRGIKRRAERREAGVFAEL